MLSVEGVSVRFDGISALSSVNLAVAAGERLGVVGPNGAGKTTLLNAVTGLVRPAAGAIRLDGRPLTGLTPDAVARAGVARTFQSSRLFSRMTVAQNVSAGRPLDAQPWLALVGLLPRRGDLAAALTPGEARRLELARALAGRPRVLLLDEPCGGLSAAETEDIAALLEGAVTPATIMVVVEHKLRVISRLCARVAVLHLGEKIFDGPPAALRADRRVLEAYLGKSRAS
jgi:ABC-type branched-subunit amino acid transport system ATPase component